MVNDGLLGCAVGHLGVDPSFEFLPIDGWQFAQIGSQSDGIVDVDVVDRMLRAVGVPMQEDANAQRKRAGHFDFVSAEEWNVEPAHLTSG